MQTIVMEELTRDAFWPFGVYAGCVNPQAEKFGAGPVAFYRDLAQLDLGRANLASFSTCRVEPRPLLIALAEYHSACGEGILPLDGDVLIHIAPASKPDGVFPLEKLRVFRIPQGMLVILRPGVWHHAPFSLSGQPVNVLIVLPERTYANDCVVHRLPEADQVCIELQPGS